MPEPRALLAQMCLSGIQGLPQPMFSWFASRAAEILSDLLLLRITTLYVGLCSLFCMALLWSSWKLSVVAGNDLLKLLFLFDTPSPSLLSVTYKLGWLWFYVFFQINKLSALWVFPGSGCVYTHLSSVNIVSGGGLVPHHPLPHPSCMGRKPSLGAGSEPGAHCNTCLPWVYYVAIK